jgi:hypothetical protein
MERRIYIASVSLLLIVACGLVIHTLGVRDSIQPVLISSGSRSMSYSMSRHYYTSGILSSALLLPIFCAMFSYLAHRGQEIDPVSWFFVAAFYLVFAVLWIDLDRVYAASNELMLPGPQHAYDPMVLVFFTGFMGAGFWKWKQNAGSWLGN